MKHIISFFAVLFFCLNVAYGQEVNSYQKIMIRYQQKYVKEHGVVKGSDKLYIDFFPVNANYRVSARFERIYTASWFNMETSGKNTQVYRIYGVLHFTLNDTVLKLNVYQSQQLMETKKYADHLFVPFTDKTSGETSYDNGRYIDMTEEDLKGDSFVIDFNKAYNPYCAYVSNVYNCPIPPKENDLSVAIKAGEMKYSKSH